MGALRRPKHPTPNAQPDQADQADQAGTENREPRKKQWMVFEKISLRENRRKEPRITLISRIRLEADFRENPAR
jgi:hypothetical protein